jgi:DNA-binding NarL/FixJ family response regulator
MKYLISFDTDIISSIHTSEWGVDAILTLDNEITADLSSLPYLKEPMVFFIPTVLNMNNSLAYDGVTLALRILMSYIRNNRNDIDIVLMGNETESGFLLHYDYPNILKIPGFYYTRFNKKLVSSFTLPKRDLIEIKEYKYFLDNLGLKMPSSLKSTHSLTNEWCLFKWNSFMGFQENTSALTSHLYFDYLITLQKINKVSNKNITEHLKVRIQNIPNSKILLIDDKKGWHLFFKNLFVNNTNIEIRCIGKDFNKLEFPEIEKKILNEISEFNPHVIILDFRLMEDADSEIIGDMKQISGYKVLSNVLKGSYKAPMNSFGRQVIIFTATSRIENILMLRDGYADGFILKEKPEIYNGKEITIEVISKMINTLITAIDRANVLISLNEKLDQLVHLSTRANSFISPELASAIQSVSQTVRQLSQNNALDVDILKLIYLNIFNIFEQIKQDINFVNYKNNFTLVVRGSKYLVISGKSKCAMSSNSDDDWNYKPKFTPSSCHEKYCKDKSLNFAICALILFRLGKNQVEDTDWNDIRSIRNAIAHGDDVKLRSKGMSLNIETLTLFIPRMLDLIISLMDTDRINEVIPTLNN